jgi:hypothetical protein
MVSATHWLLDNEIITIRRSPAALVACSAEELDKMEDEGHETVNFSSRTNPKSQMELLVLSF